MSSINANEIVLTEVSQQDDAHQPSEVRIVDVAVTDENTALNVMVSFLSMAQKRGAFGIDEAAKIWECIKVFQKSS